MVAILTHSQVRVKVLLYLWLIFYSTMELAAIMKDKLNAGDNVVAVISSYLLNCYICTIIQFITNVSIIQLHEGVLLQGWSPKAHRLLALVERNSSFGLFVFTTSRNPPQAFTDLTINFVVPIDNDFKCDIGKHYFLSLNLLM